MRIVNPNQLLRAFLLVFGCIALWTATTSVSLAGDVYRCTVNGKTVFSDKPCKGKGQTLKNVSTTHSYQQGSYNSGAWYNEAQGYEKAKLMSQQFGAPLFIYFHADWCGYCRKLERELIDTPAGKQILNKAIKVKITPEKGPEEKAIFQQFAGKGYPSTYIQKSVNAAPQKVYLLRRKGQSQQQVLSYLSAKLTLSEYQ